VFLSFCIRFEEILEQLLFYVFSSMLSNNYVRNRLISQLFRKPRHDISADELESRPESTL
jgi:hypothetical protein